MPRLNLIDIQKFSQFHLKIDRQKLLDAPCHLTTYVTEQLPCHMVKCHRPRQYIGSGHSKPTRDAITGFSWLSEMPFVVVDPSFIYSVFQQLIKWCHHGRQLWNKSIVAIQESQQVHSHCQTVNSDDTIKFVIITQFPLAKWKRSYLNSSKWHPAHANFRSKICYSLTFGFLSHMGERVASLEC